MEVKPMLRRTLLTFAILAVALSAGVVPAAATAPSNQPEYTSAQIRKMVHEAHTVQQYTVLADYYKTRQRMFQSRAAEAMHLWAERNAVISPVYEKWPRPVDSARNLHDYYEVMANDSAAKVDRFSHLADSAPFQ
jgi:hypothetical protein